MDDDAGPTHVIDHVFLGSKAHARDREQLIELKITHILNVTPSKNVDPVAGVPNFFEKDTRFEYRRCAVFDNKAEDIYGSLDGCVAFIERAKFYGRVFVHCSKGVSRSVSMVLAYLIKIHAMSYGDALQLVQAKRPIAQPNPSFEKQLMAYAARMERLRKRKEQSDTKPTRSAVTTGLRTTNAQAIGPQLPPHLMRQQQETVEKDVMIEPYGIKEKDQEQKQLSSDATCPAMPARLKRKHEDEDGASEQEGGKTKKKQAGASMIGPARPPQGPARNEQS